MSSIELSIYCLEMLEFLQQYTREVVSSVDLVNLLPDIEEDARM